MNNKLKKIFIPILILTLAFTFIPINHVANAQSPSILKYGSSNGDVWDLQYRLKQLNYLVKIDGYYGYQTINAVKKFQSDYGITADGIVGPITWKVLKKHSLSQNEFNLLVHLVYSEARGEPYKGQVAVAAVALNRLDSKQFPNTLREVIFQEGAFTAVSDGQFWLTPNETARLAALDAVRGWDPSQGTLYYFNPKTATSAWIWSRPQILKIGDHIFTK
ncbi:spore cortex-lytic enzyme [Tepidibacillus fermentans]|uniref:Spore cortex-lytic enzyme n=1 Tax=Tepidibacillus fermentans TaxID=1281767 RepID=A0A4R3KGL4_9BACI|nr:spore cortex-lytic enzyme [Tepidibacillus fermentans]TCS82574.1 N-acetylmuramoyl-L-alanine amidase [Tepidibacillus fermentans]